MEVVQKVEDVVALDDKIHWFCPRYGPDDGDICFDEDLTIIGSDILTTETEEEKKSRQQRIEDVKKRTDTVLDACTILAFDGDDARQFQDKLKNALAHQLIRCDVCVREYHRSRSKLKSTLEGQYGTDEVQNFLEIFDDMNKTRIKKGLDTAREILLDLPPEKRNIAAAGDVGMYAMFEALNCVPFLTDEAALHQYFDRPFELVQTRKKIKLPSYSPGMVCFLYSQNDLRSAWARRNYAGLHRNVVPAEFDNSVRPFFDQALNRVHISWLDEQFLPVFWSGTHLMLTKYSSELIASRLRTIDANFWTISLEHFQLDQPHLDDLLQSYSILLERNPREFWDAMGTISPQAVLDTIFKAPRLETAMMSNVEYDQLEQKFVWIEPFVASIQANNLVPPVRTIVDQMLKRYQDKKYSTPGHKVAFEVGLRALFKALRSVKEKGSRGPITSQLLELIHKEHIQAIMAELQGVEKKDEMRLEKTQETCLQIIESSLALDIRSLANERSTILQTRGLENQTTVSELNIWKMSLRGVKPGHPTLAGAIAAGTQDLLGIESLAPRQVEASTKHAERWNTALDRIHQYIISDFLERLQSFSPEQLLELFQDQRATPGLFALLFSGQQLIHQAALDLFKILSAEDSRRDALMHVAGKHFYTTFHGVVTALKIVARSKCFSPCFNMLKLGTDLFSCLCDDGDGILRSGRKYDQQDLTALESLWQYSWLNLNVIFEQTEAWSNLGYEKTTLQEFCRSTMDFAETIFDQYSLLASVVREASQSSSDEVQKRLLERPKAVFTNVIKWLRLRDDYLITKAVRLTCKMLSRLEEANLEVSKDAASFVEGVLSGKTKTKLSNNQKAEIQRALENHFGELLAEPTSTSAMPLKKQSSLQGWTSSAPTSGRSTPVDTGKAQKAGVIDVDAWTATTKKQAETSAYMKLLDKATPTSNHLRQQLEAKKQAPSKSSRLPSRAQDEERKKAEFRLKRQQDKEEADRQRAAALAKANGVSAGSGVQGLGNIGKDHSMKGQNVMVSSSEESGSEEDDFDDELFGPSVKKEKKARPTNVHVEGAVGLKPEQKRAPTRIQRGQRSLKDMRARLAPNLQSLHRTILQWDFFHDGDYPPGSNEHQFRQVANTFTDPTTYQNTFQPLLTLEAWQGMVKAREENQNKEYQMKVLSRSNVDGFIEISSSVDQREHRELQLQEGDIILLNKSKKAMEKSDSRHCLARIYRTKRQKGAIELVYQLMPGSSLAPHLTTGVEVYAVKIQSIVPLEREYGALQGLQYYDLCNQIVRARPSDRITFSEKQIAVSQDIWNVNRAQAEAINAAMVNEGFSLIQGPPGSGKTKTIVAIVGGLLSNTLGSATHGTKINVPGQTGARADLSDNAPKKLLVCAPSNAAVDELVMRLKDGVKTKHGRHYPLNVVRIGRSDAINSQVLDVTMDELVSKRLGTSDSDQKARAKHGEIFKEHQGLSNELTALFQKRDSSEITGKDAIDLQEKIVALRRRKNELGNKIDTLKDQEKNAGREAELNRKKAQQAVLDQAHVICATLSGSGHDMFQNLNIEFETVIIDEAAQCVEMSSLIPLKYGCVKCIMVGDPKQLPPTVFSKEAARFQYEQSLFVRMQNNFAKEVHLLDTQYRMHPDISLFPSRTFYDGLLKDGKGMAALRQRPWHASELLATYRFFDVKGQHQAAPRGHSLINYAEIDVAMALYARVRTDFGDFDFRGKIGIITPYKSQLSMLKSTFIKRFGDSVTEMIEFNTTDAFQGRESEIIIFSCVRASPAGGIGFLQDIRRMNVGLTRAKSSLWVLGNSDSLVRGRYWKMLVEDARSRDSYSSGDIMQMLGKPSRHYQTTGHKDHSMHDVSTHQRQMIRSDSDLESVQLAAHSANSSTKAQQPADNTRMEGIMHRFEDRVKNKRLAPVDSGDKTARRRIESLNEDVEMADASDGVRDMPPSMNGASSLDVTPKPMTGNAPTQANGTASRVAPQTIIRRGGTDPFIRPRRR